MQAARVYGRIALGAGAVFALVAVCSAAGWLLPWDEVLLRALLVQRTCTTVALSTLASFAAAIESILFLTAVLVLVLLLAGPGLRAVWLGAWVLSLPLELAFKLSLRHPLPANVMAITANPLVCEGSTPLTNPSLSPLTDPTTSPLMNPEGQVIQPLLHAAVGHTFPSGYAVRLAFFTTLACIWLWSRLPPARRWWVVAPVALLAALLAGTRLLLVWHWPSDVLGGIALGVAMACVARVGWELTPLVWRRLRLAAGSRAS